MNDQFPPPGWFLRPQSWPYGMPNMVWNGGLTPRTKDGWDPSTWTPSTWDPSTWNPGRVASLDWTTPADTNGGILGTIGQQVGQTWSTPAPIKPDVAAWPPSPLPSPSALSLASSTARPPAPPTAPDLPISGPGDWYPSSASVPTTAVSPKDFRTWLHDALSDQNVRYYAGPGFYQALQKLHALAQLLPGSGTVQSVQDGTEAGQALEAGNYGKAAAHLGIGTVNAGLDWIPGGKVLAIPLGLAAKTFPRARVKIAEEMEAAGHTAPQVTRETGLYRGAEGKWRIEAPDAGYHVRPEVGAVDQEGYRVAPLFEHHVHPALQKAYPHFGSITSRLKIDPSRDARSSFDLRTNTLTVRAPSVEEAERAGIHELVHPIQEYEKFARPVPFSELLMQPGVSFDEALRNYYRLASEAEARNAEKRLRWSEERRRAEPFPETEDLPRDQQIIR